MSPMLVKIESLTLADSFNVSLLGIAIVFFVLVGLLVMIRFLRAAIGKIEAAGGANAGQAIPVILEKPQKPLTTEMIPAKDSTGEVKLHNVNDKTAALIMAIVANKMEAPLNELRFISIREKTQSINSAQAGTGSPKTCINTYEERN